MAKGRGGACATARAPREEPGSLPAAPSEGPGASAGKPAARGCGPGSRRGPGALAALRAPQVPSDAWRAVARELGAASTTDSSPRARARGGHWEEGGVRVTGRGGAAAAGVRAGRTGAARAEPHAARSRAADAAQGSPAAGVAAGPRPLTRSARWADKLRAPPLRRRRASRAGAEPEAGAGPAPLHQFPEGVKTIHAHSKPRKQLKGYAEQNVAPFSS